MVVGKGKGKGKGKGLKVGPPKVLPVVYALPPEGEEVRRARRKQLEDAARARGEIPSVDTTVSDGDQEVVQVPTNNMDDELAREKQLSGQGMVKLPAFSSRSSCQPVESSKPGLGLPQEEK